MDSSYIAGFFDGEGCICLAKPNKTSRSYHLSVSITQNNREILVEIQKLFGGGVYPHKVNCYSWQATKKEEAYNFLSSILPYLYLKKKEAEIGLVFLKLNHNWHKEERELCRKALHLLKTSKGKSSHFKE